MGRGNVLPTKSFISEVLSLTSLLFTKGGGDRDVQRFINIFNTFNSTFTKETLVKI